MGDAGVVGWVVGVVMAVTTGGGVVERAGPDWCCWAESQAGRLSMRVRLRRMEVGGGKAGEGCAAGGEVEAGVGSVVGVVIWVVGGVAVGWFKVMGKEWLSCLARKTRAAASRRPSTALMNKPEHERALGGPTLPSWTVFGCT